MTTLSAKADRVVTECMESMMAKVAKNDKAAFWEVVKEFKE